jgi:glycosidase
VITIGVYPSMFHAHNSSSDLEATHSWLSKEFNATVGAHLLPFWRSEGDGGFALSSWSEVDPALGTMDDVQEICRSRPVFIDGIYNHAGWSHPITKQFLTNPSKRPSLVTAVCANEPPLMPNAPRGGTLYKPHRIGDSLWHIRQTFSQRAVDINLHEPEILGQIFRHLELLSAIGAKGVRLDAVEYYGRQPTKNLMNNADGIATATLIADKASSLNLEILLQMDFDSRVVHYKEFEKHHPVIVDYSFPTYLVHAFMTGTTHALVRHISNTAEFGEFRIQRPVRTHDGVLMRSVHQPADILAEVVSIFQQHECHLRYTNGVLYECNNSLPFLLNINDSVDHYYRKIGSALILAELTADSSYIYAGSLLGDAPEHDRQFTQDPFTQDPRELQRRSIHQGCLESEPWNSATELKSLINILSDWIAPIQRSHLATDIEVSESNGTIEVQRRSLGLHAVLNFTDRTVLRSLPGRVILQSGGSKSGLGPFGYIVCESK